MDIREMPYIKVVDTYTKEGVHLSSVATAPDGSVVWEEGRQSGKDVGPFFETFEYPWMYWYNTPEVTQEMLWPDCKVDGCRNKSCRRLNSEYCHPHTILMELKPYWEESS